MYTPVTEQVYVLSLNDLEQVWMNCHLFTIKLNKLEHVICECTEWTRYFICEQGSDDWQWLKEKGGTGSLSTRNTTFYECVKMTYDYMQLNKMLLEVMIHLFRQVAPTTPQQRTSCISSLSNTPNSGYQLIGRDYNTLKVIKITFKQNQRTNWSDIISHKNNPKQSLFWEVEQFGIGMFANGTPLYHVFRMYFYSKQRTKKNFEWVYWSLNRVYQTNETFKTWSVGEGLGTTFKILIMHKTLSVVNDSERIYWVNNSIRKKQNNFVTIYWCNDVMTESEWIFWFTRLNRNLHHFSQKHV